MDYAFVFDAREKKFARAVDLFVYLLLSLIYQRFTSKCLASQTAAKYIYTISVRREIILMELGFSGMNTCPVDSEKNIYISFETIRGTSLEVVRSRQKEMLVTTRSGMATVKYKAATSNKFETESSTKQCVISAFERSE